MYQNHEQILVKMGGFYDGADSVTQCSLLEEFDFTGSNIRVGETNP